MPSKNEVNELLSTFLDNRDQSIFASYIASLSNNDAEGAFSIMQGSGNELDELDKFMFYMRENGILTQEECKEFIMKL